MQTFYEKKLSVAAGTKQPKMAQLNTFLVENQYNSDLKCMCKVYKDSQSNSIMTIREFSDRTKVHIYVESKGLVVDFETK